MTRLITHALAALGGALMVVGVVAVYVARAWRAEARRG